MFDAHPARSYFLFLLLIIIVRFRACGVLLTGAVRLPRPVFIFRDRFLCLFIQSVSRRARGGDNDIVSGVYSVGSSLFGGGGGCGRRDGKTMTTRLIMVINYFHSVFVSMFSPWTVAKHLSVLFFFTSSAVQSPLGGTATTTVEERVVRVRRGTKP